MSVRSGRLAFVVRLALAGLLLLPSVTATHTAPFGWTCPTSSIGNPLYGFQCDPTVWEEQVIVYVESNGGSAPFLSLNDPAAGSQDSHVLGAGPTSGLTTAASSFGPGTLPQSWNISLPAKLAHDYYFNLSRSFLGTFWFTHTLNQNQNLGKKLDWTDIRAELFSDGVRIGGYEEVYSLATTTDAWIRFNPVMWPESALVRKDASLYLKISRSGGLSDFTIGTGGDHQSLLDIRYTPTDPIGATIYLKDGKIVPYDPGAEHEGTWASGGALLPLLALSGRRRTRLVPLLLVVVAFGGCVQPGSEGQEPPTDGQDPNRPEPVESSFVPVPEGEPASASGIRGVVKTQEGLPLARAGVSLLATTFFTKTGDEGHYRFLNVAPGHYNMHVDHDGFLPYDGDVEVRRANVSVVNITLFPSAAKAANDRPHLHGPFSGSAKSYEVWSGSIEWPGCPGKGALLPVNNHCQSLQLVPRDSVMVPPGTGLVRAVLTWPTLPGAAQALGFRVKTPLTKSMALWDAKGGSGSADANFYVARPSGEAFNIPIRPMEADPGHQKFTTWEFYVRSMPIDYAGPTRVPDSPTTIDVTITAYKGVLPFEPPHKDLWKGRSEIPLFANAATKPADPKVVLGFQNGPRPRWEVNGPDLWVPTGAKEIRGFLRVARGPLDNDQYDVKYKPALCSRSGGCAWATATMEGTGENRTFTIEPKINETDQFYQPYSYWIFFADPVAGGDGGRNSYNSVWYFGATVYRDPDWTDTQFA